MNNKAMKRRGNKILLLFTLIVIVIAIFLGAVLRTIYSDRRLPSDHATIFDRSLRGSIVSADGYTLSTSQKTYEAVVRGESINPEKKELFIRLFSIYSDIPPSEIRQKFVDKKGRLIRGNIVLSKDLNAKSAMQLRELAQKLRKFRIFQWVENGNGVKVLYGLDIVENGETRHFPLKDVFSPVLGYVANKQDGRYLRPEGQKGLERHYEAYITSKKNGYFQGKRDAIGTVIHDKNSIKTSRFDGMDMHLNIPLSLQRRVEMMLDAMKSKLHADEILAAVMRSDTGQLLTLATSERFDPANIRQQDIATLNPKFAEYPYEPGSVLKPLSISIALSHKVITPKTILNTENGRMKIGKYTISDDDKFASMSIEDIVIHSSNIGSSKISWKLTGKQFRDGLLGFGLSQPSGIDLSRDLPGTLKPVYLLNNDLHRASTSFGYGLHATFAQLFKAYSAFNNKGTAVTPRIVDYLEDSQGKHYTLPPKTPNLKAIDETSAQQMHDILVHVVQKGTGVKAQYPGLEIGGKTGTAHIARGGHYAREYHSSFYGFANDAKGNKYTIGVLVIRAKGGISYFAAQSAVPTFRNIVEILVSQNYLVPDKNVTNAKVQLNEELYGVEEAQPPQIPEEEPQLSPRQPAPTTPNPPSVSTPKPSPVYQPKPTAVPQAKPTPKPSTVYHPKPTPYTPPPQQQHYTPRQTPQHNMHDMSEDLF